MRFQGLSACNHVGSGLIRQSMRLLCMIFSDGHFRGPVLCCSSIRLLSAKNGTLRAMSARPKNANRKTCGNSPPLHDNFCLLILKLLPTTLTLENAMAPAATIGFSSPSAASGIAATL